MEIVSVEAEKKNKGPDKYEIEEACRTLVRAEEIKQDAKLMAACSAHLDKQKKAISSIAGLKAKAAELDAEDSSEDDEGSPEEEAQESDAEEKDEKAKKKD